MCIGRKIHVLQRLIGDKISCGGIFESLKGAVFVIFYMWEILCI